MSIILQTDHNTYTYRSDSLILCIKRSVMLCYRNRTKCIFLVRRARSTSKCKHIFTYRKEVTNWIWFTRNERTHLCIMLCLPMMINGTKSSSAFVCDMMAVDSLLLACSPWQGSSRQVRAAVQLRAVRGLWRPLLRLCSFLPHSYSPSLRRPPPDNAVTTCSIKQPQPGWQMCLSVTVVRDLVDVCRRRRNPSGGVLYVKKLYLCVSTVTSQSDECDFDVFCFKCVSLWFA